jgi:hypothetical protein
MAKLPGRERARQISAGARARTGDALDRVLDWIFAEPFEVPDADTAIRLLTGDQRPPMSALGRYLEGQAMVRIAAQVAKATSRSRAASAAAKVASVPMMTETAVTAGAATAAGAASSGAASAAGGAAMGTATSMGAAALAAAAVAAATRTTRTVRRGVNDLRVLASYVASRGRQQHVVLDRSMLRALTIAVYTDPRRWVDFRFSGSRGAAAVFGRWTRDAATTPNDRRRRQAADDWVRAIDRLDLTALADEWARRA